MTDTEQPTRKHKTSEVFRAFLTLGLTSFGGPIAHLGYFRQAFVVRRKWLTDDDFGDLVALCQFLPGPASSQFVFAVGMRQAGLLGGVAASLAFTLPSAAAMIAFGCGVNLLGDPHQAGWLHGLKLAAVAVVAQAVWGMGRSLCPDRLRLSMALAAAATMLAVPGALGQIMVIMIGAIVGMRLCRNPTAIIMKPEPSPWRSHRWAAVALAVFLILLIISPLAARRTHSQPLAVFDAFYRSGSLVFGGGHVLLPLLRAEVVPPGWVTDDQFLAGYGAAQAVPGPLFTFCGYLGAVMHPGRYAWLSGLGCVLVIFLPAWLLIGGALPFWHTLRSKAWAQSAIRGANAAVVGVLLAALYNPVIVEGAHNARDVAAAILAFGLLAAWKCPPWIVVAALAIAGQWLLH
ncbi:MAG: chromate efflux transporter [Phycisphaeraceae bacterium]|nr:chromate efflux transporter [Phycisphaeraceae bacterium]